MTYNTLHSIKYRWNCLLSPYWSRDASVPHIPCLQKLFWPIRFAQIKNLTSDSDSSQKFHGVCTYATFSCCRFMFFFCVFLLHIRSFSSCRPSHRKWRWRWFFLLWLPNGHQIQFIIDPYIDKVTPKRRNQNGWLLMFFSYFSLWRCCIEVVVVVDCHR